MTGPRRSTSSLRAVPNETPAPLTIDELQKFGNQRVTELRREALQAIRLSTNSRYLDTPYTVTSLRVLQRHAQETAEAWQRVGAIAAELLDHVRRAQEANQ